MSCSKDGNEKKGRILSNRMLKCNIMNCNSFIQVLPSEAKYENTVCVHGGLLMED
jgi:hypothetical protein